MRRLSCAAAMAALLCAGPAVAAPDSAQSAFEARVATMKAGAAAMKHLVLTAKTGRKPDEKARQAAATLEAGAGALRGLFPAGSGPAAIPETKATEAVWADSDRFARLLDAYAAATQELARAADSGEGEAFAAAVGTVGEQCGACHASARRK